MNIKWVALFCIILFFSLAVSPGLIAELEKKSIANISPLFFVRSGKICIFNNDNLDTNYLGENKHTNLIFVDRNQNLSKIIKIIQQMDEKTYSSLIQKILIDASKYTKLSYNEQQQLFQTLKVIKQNPYYLDTIVKQKDTNLFTSDCPDTSHVNWEPGCAIFYMLTFLIMLPFITIGMFFMTILLFFYTLYSFANNCNMFPTNQCTNGCLKI